MYQEKDIELIEAYLQNLLSEEDAKLFAKKLETDPKFKKEVELHRDLHEELSDDVMALRAKLKNLSYNSEIKQDPNSTRIYFLRPLLKYIPIAAVIALAVMFLPKIFQSSLNENQILNKYYNTYPMALNQRSDNVQNSNLDLNEAIQNYLDKNYDVAALKFSSAYENEKDDVFLLYKASALQANREFESSIFVYDIILKNEDERYVQQAIWYKCLALLSLERKQEAMELFKSIPNSHYKYDDVAQVLKSLN